MSKNIYIAFILLFACCYLQANDNDSVLIENSMSLPDKVFFERVYSHAATGVYRPDAFSNGKLEVQYNYSDMSKLGLLQEGDRLNQYKLSAMGQTVKDNKVFWGKIGFRQFKKNNVQWSDVYDYKQIGPYIITDSIGGDTYGEEYDLSGGLSMQYGKWIFGGEAGYIAGHSYRKLDPRPISNASDSYLTLSLSYNLFPNYQVGLSGQIGKYREKVSVEVQQEKTDYNFFSFKGFGQYHPRLSGFDSSYSWLYEGFNYGGSFFFVPQNKTGFLGSMTFNYAYVDSKSGNQTPYTYNKYNFSADLGWQYHSGSGLSFVKLSYDNFLGKGIERVFYTMKVNTIFDQSFLLYSAQFYSKKTSSTKLSLGHEWISAKRIVWILLDAGIDTYNERYVYPINRMAFDNFLGTIELGGEFRVGKVSTFIPKIQYMKRNRMSDAKLNISLSKEEMELYDMSLRPNNDYLFANLNGVSGELTYQHRMKNKTALYITGGGNCLFNGSSNSRYALNMAIGLVY